MLPETSDEMKNELLQFFSSDCDECFSGVCLYILVRASEH